MRAVRNVNTLPFLTALVLSLVLTLGIFGLVHGDGCDDCDGRPCPIFCLACPCCSGDLAGVGAPDLRVEAQPVAAPPLLEEIPLSATPRGILHVPRPA